IDRADTEPAQTCLALPPDAGALEPEPDLAVVVPHHPAFGEDVRPLRHALQRLRHHLLRMAEAVHGRGVDPVHAAVQGLADHGDRLAVVLTAPGPFPPAAADRPRTEP